MTFLLQAAFTLLVMAVPSLTSPADEGADHPIVAGFERFPDDSTRAGLLLLGELNCTSCHKAESPYVVPKQAPDLRAVGSRVKMPWMRSFIADPQAVKPGTTMPNALASLPESERKDTVEAISHFLATTGKTSDRPIDRNRISPGSTLYHEIGCAVCHGPRDGTPFPAGSIPLPDLSAKYTLDSLRVFLQKPHEVRPSGRMPSLNLDENQAGEIANFLRKDASASLIPTLAFQAYEGTWQKLPNFDGLKPEKTGKSAGFDLSQATKGQNFAMRFEGFLKIQSSDVYTFHITSDDGSKLWIDGHEVANSDGIHPSQTGTGPLRLAPGFHEIVVGYFDGGGQTELTVEMESKTFQRQSIEPYLSLTNKPAASDSKNRPEEFVLDAGKVDKGRELFASLGCASCHSIGTDQPVASRRVGQDLSALKAESGCLATSSAKSVPKYALNAAQRKSLGRAIEFLKTKPSDPSGPEQISRTLMAFNCYACHAREGVGGVEETRKDQFKTTYQDLGDEGKFPPHLNGVGGKLKKAWLDRILANGAKDRPYMKTRMPSFGEKNVGQLAGKLIAVDPAPRVPAVVLDQPEKKIKTIGRHLVGTQAFGCVQCHNFRGEQSAGIPAIDMTIMTERLNHDWFVRYLKNPQEYRPGTRMPSAWPNDESQLADILDGSSRKQIESVWNYLSDGSSANPPYGIGRSPIPLVADKEAILYRGFIAGAGPRGIGVGLPEKVNLAFDANEGRVALIWRGEFIDASRHWTGRGEGFQPPLGDDIAILPSGPSFASLSDMQANWPKSNRLSSDYKFKGYRLTAEGRPTFLYTLAEMNVEDAFTGLIEKKEGRLQRTISLKTVKNPANLYYRVAAGKSIKLLDNGWYDVDGIFATRLEGVKKLEIRTVGGQAELLAPVQFDDGKTKLTQIYRW